MTKLRATRDPFDELQGLVDAISGAKRVEAKSLVKELCRFLDGLTATRRTRVIERLVKLPRSEQSQIHGVICKHAYWLSSHGPAGPGAPLLKELGEALKAQVDSLPDPGPIGGRSLTAEEWRAIHAAHFASILVQCGWPEALGRAAGEDLTRLDKPARTVEEWTAELVTVGAAEESAAVAAKWAHDTGRFYAKTSRELGRDLDDTIRDEWIRMGMSSTDADAFVEDDRRNRKWSAASDAALPAKVLADKRAAEDAIRKACPRVAKRADTVAKALAALAVETTPAGAAAALRDGVMGELTSAIWAASPQSPTIFELVRKEHRAANGSPYQWHHTATATDEMVDAIAEGAALHGVLDAAEALKALADEARTWGDALKRGRGRPTKPGVDGALALKERGLKPTQLAMVLDRHGLKLDGKSPAEAARQAAKTRRRRTKR
jgi:hypothetical protein